VVATSTAELVLLGVVSAGVFAGLVALAVRLLRGPDRRGGRSAR
jgi:hypothetical protein